MIISKAREKAWNLCVGNILPLAGMIMKTQHLSKCNLSRTPMSLPVKIMKKKKEKEKCISE
jgi:hypothetical protein